MRIEMPHVAPVTLDPDAMDFIGLLQDKMGGNDILFIPSIDKALMALNEASNEDPGLLTDICELLTLRSYLLKLANAQDLPEVHFDFTADLGDDNEVDEDPEEDIENTEVSGVEMGEGEIPID